MRRNSLHIDIDVDVEKMLQEKHKCGLDVVESCNKPLEYAQLVLEGDPEIYLKGTSEHRLMD